MTRLPPPDLDPEALGAVLGERAARGLARVGATVDRARRAPPDELARPFHRFGYAEVEPAFDFERRLGGVRIGELRGGAGAILREWPLPPESAIGAGDARVPFLASDAGAPEYSVDAAGEVWLDDDHIETTAVASSWRALLERLGHQAMDEAEHPSSLRVRGRAGDAVALALGASPVPEASDEHVAVWHRAGASVRETGVDPYDGEPRTEVTAASPRDIVTAMRAAAGPAAVMAVFGIPSAPAPAPGEPELLRVRVCTPPWDHVERWIVVHGPVAAPRLSWITA